MIYQNANDWANAKHKNVLLFGMSGLGKTHISNMLRASGDWFHYSVDYRIGTRYMGEFIADNAKAEAMKVPFLRELLLSDSIYLASNITFDNLAPVASYLGKPGDVDAGGMGFAEYQRRQDQFRAAEVAALHDTGYFIERAQRLYGYDHFICDTGGSICEWVDASDPEDALLKTLSDVALMVWIEGSDAHTEELIRRFDKAPKPMSYQPEFLLKVWKKYLSDNKCSESEVNPDRFIRWTYAQALAHRQPRYQAMANWGVTVCADEVAKATTPEAFDALIAAAIKRKARS